MTPIYFHSGMAGAPQYANADGNLPDIIWACLGTGFNTRTATSASASGGILTLNFSSDPGFEALQTVEIAVSAVPAVNGIRKVVANANNQVTIAIPGLPDGAVASSGAGITIKQAGAGWSKPFSSATKAVFRPPAGNRRYLQCEHVVGDNMKARGYKNMTDVDTGINPFPTVAQDAPSLAIYNAAYGTTVNAPWVLIATDKWVIFSLANAPVVVYSVGMLIFGDLASTVVADDIDNTVLKNLFYSYLSGDYSKSSSGSVAAVFEGFQGASASFPSVIDGGAVFLPYYPILESGNNVLRGVLPNAYKVYPAVPGNRFLDTYSNVAGVNGRLKPIGALASSMHFAIAIDEEAWY